MISPKTPKKTPIPTNDLVAQLKQLGLILTADSLDDLVARAATGRWSPRQLLEEIARSETAAAARGYDLDQAFSQNLLFVCTCHHTFPRLEGITLNYQRTRRS